MKRSIEITSVRETTVILTITFDGVPDIELPDFEPEANSIGWTAGHLLYFVSLPLNIGQVKSWVQLVTDAVKKWTLDEQIKTQRIKDMSRQVLELLPTAAFDGAKWEEV